MIAIKEDCNHKKRGVFELQEMWFTAKPSSTAPPSGRSVVALLRPLAWIGATLGVFPYRKMPPAPASPAVLARGKPPHLPALIM